MKISIVSTLYRSAAYLEEFLSRVVSSTEKLTKDFEIILVNDGSPDDSLELALRLKEHLPNVRIIDLSRNFGHHLAIMTGLSYAEGELVYLVDCDLEEEPELLLSFFKEMTESKADVVYGYMESRKGGWFERLSGRIFYMTLDLLTEYKFPRDVLVARLMSRRYVQSLIRHREREIFLGGLCFITGFKQIGIPVKKHSKGSTTYNLSRKISMLANSIASFSDRPLKLIFYTGALISAVSAFSIVYLIFMRLLYSISVQGWTSLLVSVWFLGGLSILFIGVIGIYLSKVFIETKARPYTIVREFYGFAAGTPFTKD